MSERAATTNDLACVVLSLSNQAGLVDAVRSLCEQTPRPVIVVVNSGGGDPAATLRAAGLDVPVVNRAERLLPGAARNVGIDSTDASFVAFLAADCRAEPGWVAARLRAHQAGAAAVAHVVTNAFPESWSAWAAYLLVHHRLMPDTPPERRRLYGVSYDRRLFERLGRFREDLRTGEDTEFNGRVTRELEIVRAAEVRTAHCHPTQLRSLFADQYVRGRRRLRAERKLSGKGPLRLMRETAVNVPLALRQALRTADPQQRRRLLTTAPVLPAAALAYGIGVLASAWHEARGVTAASVAQSAAQRYSTKPRAGGTRRRRRPRSSVR